MPNKKKNKGVEVEVKEIVDNQTTVTVNDPTHHIEEIQKEITVIEEETSSAKPEGKKDKDFWEESK